jgi:hypothetical protein
MMKKAFGRVARWYIFKPKIQIWVNFGGYCRGTCWHFLWHFGLFAAIWYNLRPFGIFNANLVHFVDIWYILWSFGTFFPVLVSRAKKNLATLAFGNAAAAEAAAAIIAILRRCQSIRRGPCSPTLF